MIAWKKDLFRDFVRFGLIGGMGTVVNLCVFVSCMKAAAWLGYSPSKSLVDNVVLDYSLRIEHLFIAVAFVVANVFNFTMNSRFNFTARERVNRGARKIYDHRICGMCCSNRDFRRINTPRSDPIRPCHLR